ncbi:hypothetical protein HYR99_01915 [Candidatus Poribacteria bacterium]|nr:hypothetical protein [Candidatus Poribacteria bacterium]
MLKKLTYFSIERPQTVILIISIITLVFMAQFLRIHIDTDPENMLETDQPDRVFYDQMKESFGINDLIVLGITDEKGIFTSSRQLLFSLSHCRLVISIVILVL